MFLISFTLLKRKSKKELLEQTKQKPHTYSGTESEYAHAGFYTQQRQDLYGNISFPKLHRGIPKEVRKLEKEEEKILS